MSRSSRRNARTRAVASLLNAQANLEGARNRRAQIELDDKRFDDAVAQRDRYHPVVAESVAAHEVRVFTYEHLIASAYPTTTGPSGELR